MADVSALVPEGPPQSRGQMLLVAAFGLAVMFVALALILNTSIYTENIATRGSDISGGGEALRYRAATESSVAGTMEFANYHNNSTYGGSDGIVNTVHASVESFSQIAGRQQAEDGVATSVTVNSMTEGERAFQPTDGNFSDDHGNDTWVVAENVGDEELRDFRLNLDSSSLTVLDDFGADHELFVVFRDSNGDEWHISLYEDANTGEFVVDVLSPSGREECHRTSASRLRIDVTGATVNGENCAQLEFFSDMQPPYSLSFNDTMEGGNPTAVGRYNLTVRDGRLNRTHDHFTHTTVAPHTTPAVYATSVHLTYESPRLHFETDVRVAPGEPE